MKKSKAKEPYFVEVINNGCSKCGHEREYAAIGPDGSSSSETWLDDEEAASVVDMLNDAYYNGAGAFEKRLHKIEDIIDGVEIRCQATDGDVTPTLQEMTADELRDIYALASGKKRRK